MSVLLKGAVFGGGDVNYPVYRKEKMLSQQTAVSRSTSAGSHIGEEMLYLHWDGIVAQDAVLNF